jgi:general stress protein YciG
MNQPKKRGLAGMTKDQRTAAARKGGLTQAAIPGRMSAISKLVWERHPRSQEYMREMGRKGGKANKKKPT